MSVDPATQERDGPYVLLGDQQLSTTEVRVVVHNLLLLAELAARSAGRGEEEHWPA